MTRTTIVIAGALAFAAMLPAAPALAQRARVFVASYGNDSNPCTFGSPCKTFQQAVNVVAAGGEVTAIDSAGFGPVTIIQSVTITSPNGVEAGIAAPASGNAAITINAGPGDVISLNGLTLDGDNVANTTGIQFNSGSSLEVRNSVIRNFGTDGLSFVSGGGSYLSISNTSVLDNNGQGISISSPTAAANTYAALDHVDIEHNLNGLNVANTVLASYVNVVFSDSVSSNNLRNGISVNTASVQFPADITIRNSTIANNGWVGSTGSEDGVVANGAGAIVTLTRSTVTGNKVGLLSTNSGSLQSYGDNNFFNNTFGGNAGNVTIGGYQ